MSDRPVGTSGRSGAPEGASERASETGASAAVALTPVRMAPGSGGRAPQRPEGVPTPPRAPRTASSDTAQRLGHIVRALRAEAGFSQESFSALVNLHRTFMGSLERGRVNPSLETVERLAQGLRMSAWELLKMAETNAASR